jgi:hypothetical protein
MTANRTSNDNETSRFIVVALIVIAQQSRTIINIEQQN